MDDLLGASSMHRIDNMRRQLGLVDIQARHHGSIPGHLQGVVLVGNVPILHRDHYQRPINEHGIRHVLGNAHRDGIGKLDVTNARLHRYRHVPNRGVQANILNLPQVPEKHLHLVLGGLGRNVRNLDHFCGPHRHVAWGTTPVSRLFTIRLSQTHFTRMKAVF